jgi:hypothetical protein
VVVAKKLINYCGVVGKAFLKLPVTALLWFSPPLFFANRQWNQHRKRKVIGYSDHAPKQTIADWAINLHCSYI